MTRQCVWSLRLLLVLQPLWLLVLAAPLPEWARDLTKPWSSPSPDHLPESPHKLISLPEPEGSDYMDPPAPAQMLAPPQELTETLDMDSATDQFAGTHQDLNDHLTPHQKLPEVGPVLDWEQNQALALPPQLKSKIEPPGMSQAEGHQSFEILVPPLDSHSSRATKFTVSPPNLKKDLAQHRQLAKVVVGTSGQLAKITNRLNQPENDYLLDPSFDVLYPSDSLPLEFLGTPASPTSWHRQPPDPPEEVGFEPTLPSDMEGPELPEEEEPSVQQEAPQAMKPFIAHQEVPNLPPESATEMERFPLQQEGPVETLQTTEEDKPPVPEEVPSKPSEPPHKLEPSPVQQETPFQTPEVLEEITTPSSVHHEMTLQPPGQNQIHHSTVPTVTIKPVDVELALTQEPTEEVQSCPTQQEGLA
ncbi:PREDICTED: leucine-rich repeat-containing protein 37B-like [Chrysochloris asiatica]|uniref:Leucine-rich repeat-containing protein 37B-like n=1 Tax=Chrysochloris asiatica TaxID=185453 RepID=A0A9B0WXE0_CHRAS|nr:PREDICTED: leucine-rich repeat-containing protein 37B-like [Chrysochloris asiatica]